MSDRNTWDSGRGIVELLGTCESETEDELKRCLVEHVPGLKDVVDVGGAWGIRVGIGFVSARSMEAVTSLLRYFVTGNEYLRERRKHRDWDRGL